ncbi:MAG: dicarboxylate/amino acid:cation symporter [Gammaproteobacteria bacterium]
MKLHWKILIALLLALVAGLMSGTEGRWLGIHFYAVYGFMGTLFMNALMMIIVPLIMSSIISGIAGVGETHALGRLGLKTIAFYLISGLLAILVGLAMVNTLQPGLIGGEPAQQVLGLSEEEAAAARERVQVGEDTAISDVFLRMVPPNVIAAAANGQMLGLIFFSLLFGYFMTRIEGTRSQQLQEFWQGLFEVMMRITDWVIRFTPYGVFGLVAKVVAETGAEQLEALAISLGTFTLTVLLALAIHLFITLPLLLRFVAGVSPWRHFQAMAPALLTSFSTASSSATLPLTMECVEKNAGVSNRTSSFVLPLGATVNMDGTALYECVVVMFLAQAYGLEMSLATQFTVVLLALLTSIGVAGIPAASLVAIAIILNTVGLPIEAIGMILVVDRILDMCRTSVNVFSDSCGAVIIGRSEGEQGILQERK